MNGQGRPPSPYSTCRVLQRIMLLALVTWLHAQSAPSAVAEPTSVGLRFEWGGDAPGIWIGSVAIDGGKFTDFQVLGLAPDQPGVYVNEGDRVRIGPRVAARRYGFEAMVTGDLDSTLRVALRPQSNESVADAVDLTFTLRDLLDRNVEQTDLAYGHRLTIRRTPGDKIRVRFPRDHLIFAPGERPSVDIQPVHTHAKPGSSLRIRLRIQEAGTDDESLMDVSDLWQIDDGTWTRTETLRVSDDGHVNPLQGIELPIPNREGSYELSVELSYRLPLVGNVARRTIPLVVLDPQRPPLFGNGTSTLVTEFDPAHPDWRDYLSQIQKKSPLLPGLKKGPWSNRSPFVQKYRDTDWTHLPQDGWVGYSLSGAKPQIPHILEIEFPPGVEQDVGISIVEPKGDTPLDQLHGDAGITIGDRDLVVPDPLETDKRTRHRIVFWPKSNAPVVVISNRNDSGNAVFGKIRLESYPQGLPVTRSFPGSRKRIAVLRGDLLRSIFQANDQDRSADNWGSFLTSATRLVSYLRFAGYDGATVSVVSDGSALYPSQLLHPTGKFDGGQFIGDRRDPFRKDVLELLFQLFDREGLLLLPAVEFATPLPELESTLASTDVDATGIELVDVKQRPGAMQGNNGLAPYYNPLDQRVQRAMARVVRELTQRYHHHDSFQGIQWNCRAQGFSQMPGVEWGLDPATTQAFIQATARANPEWKSQGAAQRLASLLEQDKRTQLVDAWIRWRATRLTEFYLALADMMASQDRKLFISIIDLMESQPWQQQLRPALPRKATAQQVLLELGIDLEMLQKSPHLLVLRPNRLASLHHLGAQAVNLEANELDIQQAFQSTRPTAAQFHYEASIIDYPDFDRDGPTRKTRHRFLTTFQRAGRESRRHLALGLAQHDDTWIFEGGSMLPFGQEQANRSFFQVYRRLPNRAFQRLELKQAGPIQAWVSIDESTTVAYFVNPSPWKAQVGIQWRSLPDVEATAIGREDSTIQPKDLLGHYSHDVAIEPYGIYALQFNSPRVELLGCQTELPSGVAQLLHVQLDEIVSREKRSDAKTTTNLLQNPSFEGVTRSGSLASWRTSTGGGGVAEPHIGTSTDGDTSLRLYSPAHDAAVRVTSEDFPSPETGRLVVRLKLRNTDTATQPPLVLRLESTQDGYQPFHLFESIPYGEFADQGLRFDDLPMDPNLRLRISLELVGPGEVLIDDIRLYDRWIFPEEKKDLKKILHRASTQVDEGDFAACYQTLSGYWPRFLLRHVPSARLASRTDPLPVPSEHQEPRDNKRFDFRRFLRLRK